MACAVASKQINGFGGNLRAWRDSHQRDCFKLLPHEEAPTELSFTSFIRCNQAAPPERRPASVKAQPPTPLVSRVYRTQKATLSAPSEPPVFKSDFPCN